MDDLITRLEHLAQWFTMRSSHPGLSSGLQRAHRDDAETCRQAAAELQHWRSAAESCGETDGHGWATSYDELTQQRDEALAEVERLRAEVERMVNVAGDALETDPSLRSPACVDALADYVQTVRADAERRYPDYVPPKEGDDDRTRTGASATEHHARG